MSTRRSGFTLVEMLVAVGLVVLMMVLFATVFQIATGTMSKQKGLAENDQKARLLQTMLMGDIQKRTFRNVWPWAGEEGGPGPTVRIPGSFREGYLYISENDPNDDTDDVLQFTIAVFHTQKNKDESPLYGRAVPLRHSSVTDMDMSVEDYAQANPQQPEFDDGQANVNYTASSTIGEVAYFLRNGTLYRRLMLVRTPFVEPSDGTGKPRGNNSANQPDQELIDAPYVIGPPAYATKGSGVFWRDFDFSAVNLHAIDSSLPNLPTFLAATASGSSCLDNSYQASGSIVQSLGMPNMRWGFRVENTGTEAGKPREYVEHYKPTLAAAPQDATWFFGRFTHEETSHGAFNYPGTYVDAATCPYSNDDLTLIGDRGVINEFRYTGGGTRRGEDIMMTNVHAFDIRVYDDNSKVQGFVNLGNTVQTSTDPKNPTCHYCQDVNEDDQAFGPHGSSAPDNAKNNVFDTWHPSFKDDNDNMTQPQQPPYRPWDKGPDGEWGVGGVDDDGQNGIDDIGERGWIDSDDQPRPLRAIQIHMRYVDPASDQMRDLTMIHALVD